MMMMMQVNTEHIIKKYCILEYREKLNRFYLSVSMIMLIILRRDWLEI